MTPTIKSFAVISVAFSTLCLACNNQKTENKQTTHPQSDSININQSQTEHSPNQENSFDINSIAISNANLGDFPFFSFPEGLKELNKPIKRNFDRIFFPINGVMTPLEGKVWKANVTATSGKYDDWSLLFFEKSYDEAIKAIGGVKIFDGQITKEEYDRYHEKAAYLGEEGSIGYTGENIKVYIIRRADGGDIYVQLAGNTAGGKINILQQEAFKQTITMLKSDQIQQELDQKGKAVLYINFDLDKATLKTDGKEAVAEITTVLQNNKNLKINIEGHTDDTGNAAHNKTLSESRANTVKNELIASGIDASRLKAIGYGSDKPLVANDSEENKAKNRRVELVKQNP